MRWPASQSVTVAPPAASALAASIPAGPAPTTATVSGAPRRRARGNSTSRPARGLTRHDTGFVPSEWSMHASLQPMQVFTSGSSPEKDLATIDGSARNGRAIDTRSTFPDATMRSACGIEFTRLEPITGIELPASRSARFTSAARSIQTPCGTSDCVVGTRDSCHPMPTSIASAPAATWASARAFTSSWVEEPGTRSAPDIRTRSGAVPTARRTAAVTAVGKARRRAESPPHSSSRRLVTGEANWLIR